MFGYLFLISGLFLGWSLGANDASNIFGTAVGTRMVKFRTAAIIASIFVILGAVIQGAGTTETLSRLGSVDAVGGAFTVALCAGIIVTFMTKYRLPVSTGQAIVGAIIGWCFYTATPVDYSVLVKILGSWVFGPILGMMFGYVLYILLRKYIRSSRIHMLKMEAIIRTSLIVVGAFAAYSLGANNIANVMGVFVNSFNVSLTIGSLYISSTQLLFFIGSLAIALGICTYSKKVIDTVGNGVLAMTPEMAIVVVLAQALVLFIFSSTSLSNALVSIGLPAIPLVPVSSTQVLIGAIIGVGLVKGVQELKLKMVGGIMLGWVTTPVLSGLFTFISLFFVEKVFGMQVSKGKTALESLSQVKPPRATIEYHVPTANISTFFLVMTIILLIGLLLYTFLARKKALEKARAEGHREAKEKLFSDYQNALKEIEVNTVQLENTTLATRLEERKNQLVTYSLSIGEQRKYLESISESIEQAIKTSSHQEKNRLLKSQLTEIKQRMSFKGEVDEIYRQAEQVYMEFVEKLDQIHPKLTNREKEILVLLRIGLSSKEMAPLLNISTKSVEIARYRLRNKLGVPKEKGLTDYIKSM
ncbi:MAG TPA: inorganic phosphate transporter [Bacteroidales bacterium]|jgi:PiT family inorganic phosphate transporter|nr:inorganic phosphate transporter [Bacteroidales bacterium]